MNGVGGVAWSVIGLKDPAAEVCHDVLRRWF